MNLRRLLLLAATALTLVNAEPAYAGPLVGAIGAAIGAGTVGTTIIGAAVSLGASWLMQTLFAPETEQRGVKQQTENGAGLPPHFIFGRYATAGTFLYQNVLNEGDLPNQCYVAVIGLSMLPVKGIEDQFFLQKERVTINQSSSWPGGFKEVEEYVKGGDDGGYCLAKFHDGTQTTVDPWLLDKFGSDPLYPIHEDCAWRGCAYVILQCWYSNRGIWRGWPEAKFVVHGIPLYDPRKDSTVGGSGPQRWGNPSTWGEAPSNGKVVAYNFIRGVQYEGERVWGGDAEAYRLPLDVWFAAMNSCDEDVEKSNGDFVKRGHIGGEIHFDDDPREILNEIDKSVSGYTSLIGGFYKTWCGLPGLPVMTITDDDFIVTEEREDELFRAPEETYNTAYAYYPDSHAKWDMKDSPRYVDHDALDADGREYPLDIQLPFVEEPVQVQLVMRGMVKDSQRQITHGGFLPPYCYVLEPFDRVMYISAENGYTDDGKAFRFDSGEDHSDCRQNILFREINLGDQAWLTEYELEDSAGSYGNPVPSFPDLEFTLTADEVDTDGKKDRPAIAITWDWGALDTGVRRVEWKIRRFGTTKKIAEGVFRRLETGEHLLVHPSLRYGVEYEIAFMFIWTTPSDPEWGSWQAITMLDSGVSAPTSLMTIGKANRIVLKTTKSTNKNFSHWNLWGSDTDDKTTRTLVDDPKGIRMVEDGLGKADTRYYWISEVDRWGNESALYPSTTAGVEGNTTGVTEDDIDATAPNTPSVPSITSGTAEEDEGGAQEPEITIAWTPASTGPLAKTFEIELWRSPTLGGTYTRYREFEVDGRKTAKKISPNSKFYYKAKIQAKGFSGETSGFSSLTATGVKPNKRGFNLDDSTLGLIYYAYRKKHEIRVVGFSVNQPGFSFLEIYDRSSGDLVYEGKSTKFTRHNPPATTGYKVRVFDRFGNFSAYVLSPSGHSGGNVGVGDVDTGELADFAAFGTRVAVASGGSSTSNIVQSVSGVETTDVISTLLFGSLRNNDSVAIDVPITLGTKSYGTVRLAPGGVWTGWSWETPSSSYSLSQTGGNDLSHRSLSAWPWKGK